MFLNVLKIGILKIHFTSCIIWDFCVLVCAWCTVTSVHLWFLIPGSLQRDFWSPDPSPVSRRTGAGGGGCAWAGERATLRKTVSVDDRLLQPASEEQPHLRLLSRLKRGRKKLHNIQVSFLFILTWAPHRDDNLIKNRLFIHNNILYFSDYLGFHFISFFIWVFVLLMNNSVIYLAFSLLWDNCSLAFEDVSLYWPNMLVWWCINDTLFLWVLLLACCFSGLCYFVLDFYFLVSPSCSACNASYQLFHCVMACFCEVEVGFQSNCSMLTLCGKLLTCHLPAAIAVCVCCHVFVLYFTVTGFFLSGLLEPLHSNACEAVNQRHSPSRCTTDRQRNQPQLETETKLTTSDC